MAIRDVTLAGLSRETLLDFYFKMWLIRRFEEKAAEGYTLGKIGGFLHLYIGQEAVATGLISQLRNDDVVISSYREHGHALVKGVDPNKVMAELHGKATGVSKGKGGSMHIYSAEHNLLGGYAIVAAQLPIACGYGLAANHQHLDYVTMCFFGDGAVDEGAFHESLNLAELWSLPVIFVCENNLYSMGNSLEKAWSVNSLEPRAAAYGMAYEKVDGMEIINVHEAGQRAIERARAGKPTLLEVITYRFRGHSMADPGAYRPKEEVERWRSQRDPILLLAAKLREQGIATEQELQQLEDRASGIAEAASQFADASPFPTMDDLVADVMIDPTGAIAWRHQH